MFPAAQTAAEETELTPRVSLEKDGVGTNSYGATMTRSDRVRLLVGH